MVEVKHLGVPTTMSPNPTSASDSAASAGSNGTTAAQYTSINSSGTSLINAGLALNLIVWFFTGIAAMFLALRVYAKTWKRRPLWWDDFVLIAGWVRPLNRSIQLVVRAC